MEDSGPGSSVVKDDMSSAGGFMGFVDENYDDGLVLLYLCCRLHLNPVGILLLKKSLH